MRKISKGRSKPSRTTRWFREGSRLFLCVGACLFFAVSSAEAFTPPSPEDVPDTITVQGKPVLLKGLKNPLRGNPEQLPKLVEEGGTLYSQHCFLCHGDLLDGRGLFGDRFFPAPANFNARGSVFDRPESYAFWRIMKGGAGLPPRFAPWNSAMPAWEDTLTEEQVWKIILYIFDRVGQPRTPGTPAEPSLERGQTVYQDKCVVCHGPEGQGDGPASAYSSPRPRDLTKGHYKFRSTPFGKIPTDADLHAMLTRGMPGTTMPSWAFLPETDLQSLVLYLKELGKKKFEKAARRNRIPEAIEVPPAPPFDLKSKERGRNLYIQNCSGCHGVEGRSDGASTKKIVDIATDAIRPRNLTKPWTFRRGSRREDIFLTLRTGLSTTAMPRFSDRIHPDQNIWDLVNFVQTLSPGQKPPVTQELTAARVEGPLPVSAEDPLWSLVPTHFVPLGSQIIQGEKKYFTTVDSLWFQAVYSAREIAFRIRWDDPTFDPILQETAQVTESPAPPLPPHLRVEEPEEDSETPQAAPEIEPSKLPDALALQFPLNPGDDITPYFLNGDSGHPVTLWTWQSNPNGVKQSLARGMDQVETPSSASGIASSIQFHYGQYKLVMKRSLSSAGPQDISLEPGQTVPMAFNVWDGNQKETRSKKSVSSWFQLRLE